MVDFLLSKQNTTILNTDVLNGRNTSRLQKHELHNGVVQFTEPGAEKWVNGHFYELLDKLCETQNENAGIVMFLTPRFSVAVLAQWGDLEKKFFVLTVQCLKMDDYFSILSFDEFMQQISDMQRNTIAPPFWTDDSKIQTQHLIFRVDHSKTTGVPYKISETETIFLNLDHVLRVVSSDDNPSLFSNDICISMVEEAHAKVQVSSMWCHFTWTKIQSHLTSQYITVEPRIQDLLETFLKMVVASPDPITNLNHCATRQILDELEQWFSMMIKSKVVRNLSFDFEEAMLRCRNK